MMLPLILQVQVYLAKGFSTIVIVCVPVRVVIWHGYEFLNR